MAGTEEKAAIPDSKEAALRDFEEDVRRSIGQADAGLVKTFKTAQEFLNHLNDLE
jgi:hypothetical protein